MATQQMEVAGHVTSIVEELMLKGVKLKFKANIQGNKSESVAKSTAFPCFLVYVLQIR